MREEDRKYLSGGRGDIAIFKLATNNSVMSDGIHRRAGFRGFNRGYFNRHSVVGRGKFGARGGGVKPGRVCVCCATVRAASRRFSRSCNARTSFTVTHALSAGNQNALPREYRGRNRSDRAAIGATITTSLRLPPPPPPAGSRDTHTNR